MAMQYILKTLWYVIEFPYTEHCGYLIIFFLQVSNCATLNGSFRSYSIEGLRPYSEYTIDVKACTSAGDN